MVLQKLADSFANTTGLSYTDIQIMMSSTQDALVSSFYSFSSRKTKTKDLLSSGSKQLYKAFLKPNKWIRTSESRQRKKGMDRKVVLDVKVVSIHTSNASFFASDALVNSH